MDHADGVERTSKVADAAAQVVFLSYSRTDSNACIALKSQFEQAGLGSFRDEDAIRVGDRWMSRLEAVSYTHLDVYKRQVLVQPSQRRVGNQTGLRGYS